LIGAATY